MPGIIRTDAYREDGFTLECLLQELLMALGGYTGDVFVETSEAGVLDELHHPEHCTVQLAPDLPWAGTDREQLNELVRLGFHYKQLNKFIAQEQQPSSDVSLYRRAFCTGLTEILAVYEDEIVRLQQLVLQYGAGRGLPGLIYELFEMQSLMPQLHQLAYDLRRRPPQSTYGIGRQDSAAADSRADSLDGGRYSPDAAVMYGGEALVAPPEARGAKLLATLHALRLNGQPVLQACFQRLLWHVNQVLFNQLTMWMVHGVLADDGGEFFIRPRELSDAADTEERQGGPGAARQSDSSSDRVGLAAAGMSRLMTQITEDDTYRDWHEAFEVAMLDLPPFITPHLATSVEFVGRAVRLLRAPPASAKLKQLQDSCMYNGTQQWMSRAEQHQQLLPHEDTLAFASALRVLQEQPVLRQAGLERTVEAIRADVASRLWELLVVQAGLMQHLSAIKDYLLLARGDFYQCFLADAARLLASPPREATANSDLVVPWMSAAAKSTAQDDPHFKLFKLVLKPKSKQQQQRASESAAPGGSGGGAGGTRLIVPSYDGNWDDLALEAQLPWPLGVLITPRHLEKYNKMFQLLLRLKRVQLALEQAWQELGRLCGRSGGSTQAADIKPLLQLRHHMGHLIGNLQIYLQLDVVESNFAQLQAKVAQAQDFSEAEHAHERFLHALVTQSFLGHHSLITQIGEVFSQATDLCRLVRGARERGVDFEGVKKICDAFNSTMSALYVKLNSKSLQQFDKAPYLRQFYLRLDFNGYVDSGNLNRMRVYRADKQQRTQHKAAK